MKNQCIVCGEKDSYKLILVYTETINCFTCKSQIRSNKNFIWVYKNSYDVLYHRGYNLTEIRNKLGDLILKTEGFLTYHKFMKTKNFI